MRYNVYLWLRLTSEAAEVMQPCEASSPAEAIQQVMVAYNVPYADYVWVAPDDLEQDCYEARHMRCPSARSAGH